MLIAVGAGIYLRFGDQLSLAGLAAQETALRDFQNEHPILIYGIAFLVYVVVTGLSLPGAAALTLVYGWFFGIVPGVILVSFASTTGATVAFLISRYLFHDAFQSKFGSRLAAFNKALDREGAFYLFSLRLIPAVPFFVINVVMGLTNLKVRTFWWVSQLGMLAGTIVYVYAGSSVPSLSELAEHGINAVFTPAQLTRLIVAFAMLGLLPLVTKKLIGFWKARRADSEPSGDSKLPHPNGST